jgi:hypothetical protein
MAGGIVKRGWTGKIRYIKSDGKELRDMMPDEERTITVLHLQRQLKPKFGAPYLVIGGAMWNILLRK